MEAVKKGIPKLRVLQYFHDCVAENIFIRLFPVSGCTLYKGKKRLETITVSMTSFPARINQAYYAIKSLMVQSCPPDRIVLWLALNQFPDRTLPEQFNSLVEKGLEIKWCSDKRSHKKYYYALKEQKKDELVITYDDDIIYEYDSIEKLVNAHKLFPNAIICNRAHEITLGDEGIMPYKYWKLSSDVGCSQPALALMPSTGNGCLYPFGIMPDITFDWEVCRNTAPTADDIWMKFCSLKNKVKVLKTKPCIATLCNVFGSQRHTLTSINDVGGENQVVIDKLTKYFNFTKESFES